MLPERLPERVVPLEVPVVPELLIPDVPLFGVEM